MRWQPKLISLKGPNKLLNVDGIQVFALLNGGDFGLETFEQRSLDFPYYLGALYLFSKINLGNDNLVKSTIE